MLNFDKLTPADQSYYYHSTATTKAEFQQDMVQMWAEALKRIRESRPNGSWNRLFYECWCESGYIIIYPQKRGQSPHDRHPRIVVTLDVLNATRRQIDNTDDESQWTNLLGLAYILVRGAIRDNYKKEPALSELKTALENNDFTVWTMKEDDVETMMKIEILF